jgi:hypothetical protein
MLNHRATTAFPNLLFIVSGTAFAAGNRGDVPAASAEAAQ